MRIAIVPVTPYQQNCTLVWNTETKRGTVIDPGGDVPVIMNAIKEAGFTVDQILLTHGHLDHGGGAAELKEKLGAIEIVGPHKADLFLCESIETVARSYGLTGLRNVSPDRWLDEGETIDIASHTFEILHCPGHSPGSLVFVNRELKLAFMGDVLFQGSIGRTDLPGGDHQTLLNSIRNKVLPLGDDIGFICGHGPTSTIGNERTSNPFLIGG